MAAGTAAPKAPASAPVGAGPPSPAGGGSTSAPNRPSAPTSQTKTSTSSASSSPRSTSSPRRTFGSGSVVDNGAGIVMAYLMYEWVLLPLLTGGPTKVRNVWRAKFFNKDAKGNWLP